MFISYLVMMVWAVMQWGIFKSCTPVFVQNVEGTGACNPLNLDPPHPSRSITGDA